MCPRSKHPYPDSWVEPIIVSYPIPGVATRDISIQKIIENENERRAPKGCLLYTSLPGGISLSGRSISSILQAPVAVSENMEEEEGDEEPIEIDEDTETALIAGCARFSQELMQERPRMGVLFQDCLLYTSRCV